MRVSWCVVVVVALVPALAGCSDTGERCENLCDAARRCEVPHPVKDCTEYCVEHYDDSSEKCQAAFEELTDCVYYSSGEDEELCYGCADEYEAADQECDWLAPDRTLG